MVRQTANDILELLKNSSGLEKEEIFESPNKDIQKIEFLLQEMSIPTYIDKVEEKDIPEMAEHADKEANPLYPVPKLFDGAQLNTFYYQIIKKD